MNTKGFTLIEAMVAIAIVALAIVGPMYTANSAIVAAELSNDQITASYLAQEGIEYVRTMRDDAYLSAYAIDLGTSQYAPLDGWNNFLKGNNGPSNPWSISKCFNQSPNKTCTLDASPSQSMSVALNQCNTSAENCSPLYLDPSSGIYSTTNLSGTLTPFTRTFQAESISGVPLDTNGNPVEILIQSIVTWNFHNNTYTVTVTDHLTPWQ